MRHKQNGFTNLLLVLIISSALLALGLFLNQRIRSSVTNLTLVHQRNQAGASARTCLSEAYLRLSRNRAYTGGQLNQNPIFCTMSISHNGSSYTITSTATQASATRTMSLSLSDATGTLTPIHFTELP